MLARLFLLIIALVFIVGIFDIPFWPSTKWGFIDKEGKLVIPATFDRVRGIGEGSLSYTYLTQKSFHEGLAAIAMGKQWGFADKKGNIVIDPQYDTVGDFSEGLACVQSHDKCGFVDHSGNLIIQKDFNPHWLHCGFMYFQDGLCAVELANGSMGYINKSGAYAVTPSFYCAWPFSEGRAIVFPAKFNHNTLIDTRGMTVFEPENSELSGRCSEGLLRVSRRNLHDQSAQENWYVDRNGKKVTQEFVGAAQDFSEGLAAITLSPDKFGYIDKKGKVIIQPAFDKAGDFHEGLAAVGIEGKIEKHHYKWGYIDKTGAWIIPPKYDAAEAFSEGRAAVRIDQSYSSKQGYIDKTGNMVIPAKYALAFPFSEGLAAVKI